MDALLPGELEVLGGCLGAGGAVVVWPHGTTVAGTDPLTVDVPGYGTFTLGETVGLAGGYVVEHSPGPAPTGPYDVGGVEVPSGCTEHDVFLAH